MDHHDGIEQKQKEYPCRCPDFPLIQYRNTVSRYMFPKLYGLVHFVHPTHLRPDPDKYREDYGGHVYYSQLQLIYVKCHGGLSVAHITIPMKHRDSATRLR